MSDFSNVDRSVIPDRLVHYLDRTDEGLVAIKSYIAAAAGRALPPGSVVLDLGCGLGHDLTRLESARLEAIGIDNSALMLGHARARDGRRRLLRGDVGVLPLRSSSIDGCRIERVLQHVDDPARVVAEVHRVLRPGGFFAAFEPDHSSFRITSDIDDLLLASSMRARHPRIGAELPALLGASRFILDDVVTEVSTGHRFDELPVDATAVVRRAVVDGRRTAREVEAWLEEQRRRTAAGTFRSTWVKVLVVARRGD